MIRLNLSNEPRWLELLPGLRLEIRPATTAVMAAAQADIAAQPDLDGAATEVRGIALAKAVACRIITGWDGVGDDEGNPVAVTDDGIGALLDILPVFTEFQDKVLGPNLLLEQEKNGSAPSLNGTSAAAQATAPAVAKASARNAPTA